MSTILKATSDDMTTSVTTHLKKLTPGNNVLITVALCNRADHYIFALWFLFVFFFPRLISAAVDWMSTILRHMVWP